MTSDEWRLTRHSSLDRRNLEHQAVPASSTTLVEPLSTRELEVLRLIAAGHSNQAIADALGSTYHIRLKGHLASHWSAWFEGMTISNEPNGETVLCGPLPDQAALHGVLIKIRDLGLPLLAVCTVPTDEADIYHS